MKITSFALSLLLFFSCATGKPDKKETPIKPLACGNVAGADKHEAHFLTLQSKLKHGHTENIFFIRNYSRDAETIGKRYGIAPEIIVAVGILESRGGTSNISRQARNLHGIKAGDGWHGLTFVCERGKVWRAWNSYPDAIAGFCEYIVERVPRFVGKNITPAEFAYAYGCNNPKEYAANLHIIIARYGLKTLFS